MLIHIVVHKSNNSHHNSFDYSLFLDKGLFYINLTGTVVEIYKFETFTSDIEKNIHIGIYKPEKSLKSFDLRLYDLISEPCGAMLEPICRRIDENSFF